MLEDKILGDFKEAMKSKDSVKTSTLSFLRSDLKNAAIAGSKDKLDDNEVIAIIKKQIKQRLDSIEKFRQGGREDLARKEEKEAEILKQYLPKEMSPQELQKAVDEVISSLGAQGPKDMGKVMKELMPKLGGRADNKTVSDLVKSRLTAA